MMQTRLMTKNSKNLLGNNDPWPFAVVDYRSRSSLPDNFRIHWRQQKAMRFTRVYLEA